MALADLPEPVLTDLLEIVNTQKVIVNQSRNITAQINELSEILGNLNNTDVDVFADHLDSISDRFDVFRTSLLVHLGMKDE